MIDLVYERQWSSLGNVVAALREMRQMGRLFGGFPRFRYERAGIPKEIIRTFPLAALWNHVALRGHLPKAFCLSEPRMVGQWVARQKDLSQVVMANGTAHRFLFPRIKESGRTLILERGSSHPVELFLKPQQARKEAGLSYSFDLPDEVVDEVQKTELADYILAGSEVIKASYVSRGFPENRIHVASYGVDASRFTPDQKPSIRPGPLRIAIVGIISFRKGVLRALRIGEWARKAEIPLELHFVGPVHDRECLDLIHASVASCLLHGVMKGSRLTAFLQTCDAIALPSYEEGFGISVLEGMSSGLPAIVSREAGCSEAVDVGVNGIILERFDDEEFEQLLTDPLRDRNQLIEMGRNARNTVLNHYQTAASICRIQNAIQSMLCRGKQPTNEQQLH